MRKIDELRQGLANSMPAVLAGAELITEITNGSDCLLEYRNPGMLRMRFTRDRGQILADFGLDEDKPDMYSSDLVMQFLVGGVRSGVLDGEGMEFLNSHAVELFEAFSREKWAATRQELVRLSQERAKRMFRQ